MNQIIAITAIVLGALSTNSAIAEDSSGVRTTVRTELYPRPPYSGATYYIYERGSAVICTKLEVCNKFDECSSSYHKGAYKEPEDVERDGPFDNSPPAPISVAKMRRHVCLARYKLAGPH